MKFYPNPIIIICHSFPAECMTTWSILVPTSLITELLQRRDSNLIYTQLFVRDELTEKTENFHRFRNNTSTTVLHISTSNTVRQLK